MSKRDSDHSACVRLAVVTLALLASERVITIDLDSRFLGDDYALAVRLLSALYEAIGLKLDDMPGLHDLAKVHELLQVQTR